MKNTLQLIIISIALCTLNGCQSDSRTNTEEEVNFNNQLEQSYWEVKTKDYPNITVTTITDSRAQNNTKRFGPYGVFTDTNYIYVAGLRESRVVRFDKTRYSFAGWLNNNNWSTDNFPFSKDRSTLLGNFYQPHSISEGCDGNLYITEFGNRRTQVFKKDGSFIKKLENVTVSSDKLEIGKTASGLHDDDCNFYVSDGELHKIIKYNSELKIVGWLGEDLNGSVQDSFNKTTDSSQSGGQLGAFHIPHMARVLTSGEIITVDYTHRVQKFSSVGKPLAWIGAKNDSTTTNGWSTDNFSAVASSSLSGFNMPVALDVNAQNDIFIVDHKNNRIQKFNVDGIFKGWLGVSDQDNFTDGWSLTRQSKSSSLMGGLSGPTDIHIERNTIYITDLLNSRVVIYKFKSGVL